MLSKSHPSWGAVIIWGRAWGSANLTTRCTQNLPPIGICSLHFCPPSPRILRTEILPPLPIGANTFTCKLHCSHGSIVYITHHAKMTYHFRYIGKSSGIVLNMIHRVSGGENSQGYFAGASGEPSNLSALKFCPLL